MLGGKKTKCDGGSLPATQWAASNCAMQGLCSGAKKKSTIRSVRFQTWTYFFLLAALTLFVLWLFQILFFKSTYRTMKKQEVEKIGDEISARYPGKDNDDYDEYLHQKALKNGLNIIVFRVKESYADCPASEVGFVAEYLASQFNASDLPGSGLIITDDPHIIVNWDEFYGKIRKNERVSYIQNTKRGDYVVYGMQLDDKAGYLYLTTPYQPLESTVSVMTDQLLIATVICLVMSVVVSYFISERITKPITEFSRVAQRLGSGDYSVRFKGNGYTEIENLAETLNNATEEIGKTEKMRRDFLANVSHDLRTPLTMVKAYAEMIRDISGSDELKRAQHSQVIIDEADRLTSLVNDILNLSKLQSGTETLTLGRVDMQALAKIVLERFEVYAARDGYVFEFSAEGDCEACGDNKRLEQVLYNLIGNALSHTGDSRAVDIRIARTGDKVRVSVRDYGDGIAPEELDKVWERYYRANQSRRNVVGSGLGLSIVKSILVSHDAQFGVSSKLGEGTEFWFELDAFSRREQLPESEEMKKRRKKK